MGYLNQTALDAARLAWLIALVVSSPSVVLLFWKLRPSFGRSLSIAMVFLLLLSPCYNYFYLDAWMAGIWPSGIYILNIPREPLSSLAGLFMANLVPRLLMAGLILISLEAARIAKGAKQGNKGNAYPPFA